MNTTRMKLWSLTMRLLWRKQKTRTLFLTRGKRMKQVILEQPTRREKCLDSVSVIVSTWFVLWCDDMILIQNVNFFFRLQNFGKIGMSLEKMILVRLSSNLSTIMERLGKTPTMVPLSTVAPRRWNPSLWLKCMQLQKKPA